MGVGGELLKGRVCLQLRLLNTNTGGQSVQQAGVPGQVATIQNLLNADPRQDPGSSLSKQREQGGKLSIIPGSTLDRTLTAPVSYTHLTLPTILLV